MQKPLSQRVAESQKQQQHVHRQLGQVLNNYESSGFRSKQKKNDRSAARAEQEAAAAAEAKAHEDEYRKYREEHEKLVVDAPSQVAVSRAASDGQGGRAKSALPPAQSTKVGR